MTISEKQFIQLLKATLWQDEKYLPIEKPDWNELYIIAFQQSMAGMIGDYIVKNQSRFSDAGYPVPARLLAQMKATVFTIINANLKLNSVLSEVVSTLTKAGISSVLLKGQGNALYYPNPLLRQCGDIDLYVGEENYKRTAEVLKDIADSVEFEDCSIKHYHVTVKGILIEVHKTALKFTGNKARDDFYQNAQSNGLSQQNVVKHRFNDVEVSLPSDDFNSVYIFYHMYHHFMTGGVGFRQICDWFYFLYNHRDSLNEQYVVSMLEGMNEKLPWEGFASLLVELLGFPSYKMPLYSNKYSKKAISIAEYILDEGNFGNNTWARRHRSKWYLIAKTQSFLRVMSRNFRLLFLFPSSTIDYIWEFLVNGFSAVWLDFKNM